MPAVFSSECGGPFELREPLIDSGDLTGRVGSRLSGVRERLGSSGDLAEGKTVSYRE